MYTWHKYIQMVVDTIDETIQRGLDDSLALDKLAQFLGYSKFYTSKKFKKLSGMTFRTYVQKRKLAFSLLEVRDTHRSLLSIAMDFGFSSHEAFTRAFKATYGIAPSEYRANPRPVVLRTKIHPFDRYILNIREVGMVHSSEKVNVYFVSIPAHTFLHIKNYESNGYFDFWEKQDALKGQDCDTICGLLDSIPGKLDGSDQIIGSYSGQIMARIFEENGKQPEAYGIRLPENYCGAIPPHMHIISIPSAQYIVFEHGPFDFEKECNAVGEKMRDSMSSYSFSDTQYRLDESPGRISYYYFDPSQYMKRVRPVRKKQ
jgi:AraC family transcriptional regulator